MRGRVSGLPVERYIGLERGMGLPVMVCRDQGNRHWITDGTRSAVIFRPRGTSMNLVRQVISLTTALTERKNCCQPLIPSFERIFPTTSGSMRTGFNSQFSNSSLSIREGRFKWIACRLNTTRRTQAVSYKSRFKERKSFFACGNSDPAAEEE